MASMSAIPAPSRIQQARARTRTLKIAAAGAATLLFATIGVLARNAHPGSTNPSSNGGSLETPDRLTQQLQQGFFEPGSVGSSSDQPQAQTHSS